MGSVFVFYFLCYFSFSFCFPFPWAFEDASFRLKGNGWGSGWVRADVALYFVCLKGWLSEAVMALLCTDRL